jgi:glycosyltransferase involved in cell wall biosynthesis
VEVPHITVCICTFRRPAFLERLLRSLEGQETRGHFSYSIVVCDNDREESARSVITLLADSSIEIKYCSEPCQNIALARNKALENSRGEYVAFIDDDEFPAENWLQQLFATCETYQAAGVLGPVRPHFEVPPPRWVVRGKFCERPEHSTGRIMKWDESRTGNLLFRRAIIADVPAPFDMRFGTGGEDMDFFRRMNACGHRFVWSAEAVVFETVPRTRLRRTYMLKRALLRGKNILKHSGKGRLIAVSIAAFPIYLILLPFAAVRGHYCLMKYSIKLCDHAGRLLALCGLNPVAARDL